MNKQKCLSIAIILILNGVNTIYSKGSVGHVTIKRGNPIIFRNNLQISATYQFELFEEDEIILKTDSKLGLYINGYGQLNLFGNQTIKISKIIKDRRINENWVVLFFEKLKKIGKNTRENTLLIPSIALGVRGLPNNLDITAALNNIDKYIKQNATAKNIPELLMIKADCLHHLGQKQKALQVYNEILQKFPKNQIISDCRDKIKSIELMNRGEILILSFQEKNINNKYSEIFFDSFSKGGDLKSVLNNNNDLNKSFDLAKRRGYDFILKGSLEIDRQTCLIKMNLFNVKNKKRINDWSISGDKNKYGTPYFTPKYSITKPKISIQKMIKR